MAQTTKLIEAAILHEGFSVVECVTVCPTYYGRKNRKGNAVEMLKWQRDNANGKLVIGELWRCERPEYTREYEGIIKRAGGEGN